MNREREETVYVTMRHSLKKSKYIFSLYSVMDLAIMIPAVLLSLLALAVILYTIRTLYLVIPLIGILVFVDIAFIALISTNSEIYHNGIGLILCIMAYFKNHVEYSWRGIDYGEEEESLQGEEAGTEKSQKKYQKRG